VSNYSEINNDKRNAVHTYQAMMHCPT